jgi:TatD DNase family protein
MSERPAVGSGDRIEQHQTTPQADSPFPLPPSALLDTHAHLDVKEFNADREEVIARAKAAGVVGMICPGISAVSSEAGLQLAAEYEGIFAAVGIQPNDCAAAVEGDWERIVALVGRPKVVAIGETGLDRYWDFTPFDVQQDYFDRHLRLAQAHDRPVIIHCRNADADLLPMLREATGRGPLRGVMHSFSSDVAMAQACLDFGLYLSFSGAVTYTNKKFESLRQAAKAVPADRILVETDSPYLVPHPLRGKQSRNEPANIRLTVGRLAELRGTSPEELAAQTTSNARRLFGLG